jgi:Flp pilus assembly protein TadG
MRTQLIQRIRNDEGQNLVEFSLVAVMFIIVLLGVVEMARMTLVYTTMSNAARAGARYAITHGADRTGSGYDGPSLPGSTTQVETVTKNYAAAGLLNANNVTVDVAYPDGNANAGSRVTVSVNYTYDPLVGYFNTLLNHNLGSKSQGVITF